LTFISLKQLPRVHVLDVSSSGLIMPMGCCNSLQQAADGIIRFVEEETNRYLFSKMTFTNAEGTTLNTLFARILT
jgi:hypothetical protein